MEEWWEDVKKNWKFRLKEYFRISWWFWLIFYTTIILIIYYN